MIHLRFSENKLAGLEKSKASFSWQKIQPLFDQVEIYLLLSLWGGNLTSPDIMATLEELSRKRKEVGHRYKGDHILGHSDQGDPNLVI